MTWWDILYKFSWRTTLATVWTAADATQNNNSYITWNCQWFPGGKAILDMTNYPPGWFETGWRDIYIADVLHQTVPKYLNAEDPALPINVTGLVAGATHPFDQLFSMQAP